MELVQYDMTIAVVENIGGVIPYKVTFTNKIPGQATDAYLFYPQGYLKIKTGISVYPDDEPTNIINQISYDSDNYLISNNYLMDGEFLIIYHIDNEWYKFTFEMQNNQLVKVNNMPVDLTNYINIWFNKIDRSITSKINISNHATLISNINIKSILSDLNSNIIIKDVSNLDSNINIKQYKNLNSNINIKKHNDIQFNINVKKHSDLNSNIKITNYSDLNSNIKVTNYKELFCTIFTQYGDTNDIPANVLITKYNELMSNLLIVKAAKTLNSNIIVRRTDNNEINSHVSIIGKGKTSLKSHILIMTSKSIKSRIFVVKYVGIKCNIKIRPKYFSVMESKVDINHKNDLYGNLYINPHDIIIGDCNLITNKYSDLRVNINVKTTTVDTLNSNINVNTPIHLYGTSDIIMSNKNDIISNINIPEKRSLFSNIIIKSISKTFGTVNIIKNNINDIICNIKIPNKNDLYSKLNIPFNDILFGNTIINNNQKHDLISNIFITTVGINDVLSTLEVSPHDYIYNDIFIYSCYGNDLESRIDVLNSSSLISNIEVQPLGMANGQLYIKSGNKNDITSKVIITYTNDIQSNIIINSDNNIDGKILITGNADDLFGNIIIKSINNLKDLKSNIDIGYISPNKMDAKIKILDFNINGPALNSNIIVGKNINLASNIEVIKSDFNKFDLAIDIQPRTGDNLMSNIDVKNINDLNSNIIISTSSTTIAEINYIAIKNDTINSKIIVTNTNNLKSSIKIVDNSKVVALIDSVKATNSSKFKPVKDSFIMESTPTLNYGLSPNLFVGNTVNGKVKSLLGFDIFGIKTDDIIVSAFLLFNSADYNNFNNLEIHSTDYSWEEYGVTWNNAPTQGTLIDKVDNTLYRSIVSFDVTNYVTNLIRNNQQKFAFMLSQSDNVIGSTKRFYSRNSDLTPILHITYASDLTQKLGSADFNSNIEIKNNKYTDLKSKLTISRTNDFSYIQSNIFVTRPDALRSHIEIKGSTIASNIIIKQHDKNTLNSNMIVSSPGINEILGFIEIKGSTLLGNLNVRLHDKNDLTCNVIPRFTRSSDINSTMVINGVTLVSNIIINQHDNNNLNSNIIVKQHNEKDLLSTVLINKLGIPSKIIITENNTIGSNLKVRLHSENDLQSKVLVTINGLKSNIIVTCTETRRSNIIIRSKSEKDILSNIHVRPVGYSDLIFNIRIRHNDDKYSKISITRPKIDSNIIIRQHVNNDLSSTIKVYVFDGYITII